MPDRAAEFLRWKRDELERFDEYCERFDREMSAGWSRLVSQVGHHRTGGKNGRIVITFKGVSKHRFSYDSERFFILKCIGLFMVEA
ncbi:hypothetical protein [Paenibacillus sp. JJ-223]|nr:hypothetical protein [Paenibacillus sp. JJ-223]